MKEKLQRFNSVLIGVVTGIFFPVVGFFVYYFWNYSHKPFLSFLDLIWSAGESHMPIASFCLVFNGVLFFAALQFDLVKFAKGILATTIAYLPFIAAVEFL